MQGATHHTHGWPHALVACAETPRAWSIHLVLLHVKLHVQLTCMSTPRASVDTHLAGQLTPRSEPMQQATSSFSVHWPDFGPSAHRTSLALRVCLCLSVSKHRTSVDVHHTHRTSVGVPQHTQDVCGCPSAHTGHPWLSVCVRQHTQDVRGCPSAHTGRPCVSVSTHRTSVAVHQYTYQHAGPWTQHAGPSRRLFGLSRPMWAVYLVHTGRPWVSVSTHRTSVGVRQHTQDVRGCPCVSVCVRQHTQDVHGCPSVHISARCTHMTSVGVRQHTQDVCGHPCVSVCVCLCPSADTGRLWLSIITQISTLYTQDVRGCLPAHTRRPWLSVAVCQQTQDVRGCLTNMTSVAVRLCPCVSVSTHRTSVAVHQYTYQHVGPWTQHADPSRGLFVQYTQDVCGCPCVSVCVRQHTQDVRGCPSIHISAHCTHRTSVGVRQHTGHPWLSVCVRVCPSANTGSPWLSISTHISTLVLGLSTLALPVDCLGDFWPTWAVCSVHTGRPWVSASTHRTSVALRGCPSAHTGRPWLSVCVRQHTQDIRGCPSAHTGRLWLSISTHSSTLVLILSTLALPVDCSGDFGPRVSRFSTHRTSVAVRQHTQDVRGCPSAHTGRPWLSVCVCVCPSAHTGRPWLSISTHISTLVLGLSKLTLPVDCSGDFGPRGLSVQYTQDVCGCPPAHRTSLALRVCPCLSVSKHRKSVAVHQYTYQHYTQDVRGCPPAHIGRPWLFVAVRQHTLDVHGCPCVSVSTHRTSVGVRQHTHDVCGCPSVHIAARWSLYSARWPFPWTVRVILAHVSLGSVHTGRPWLSVSTHRTSVGVRQHKQDVRGCPCVSVCVRQHTQDVHGCPSVHISPRWTSVGVRQHTEDVCGSPCVSVCVRLCPPADTGRPWLSISTQISTTHRTSVGVRQHTHDVRDCPCVSVSTHRTSVTVRVCPSAHTGCLWLSISTHISTLVLGLSTLVLGLSTLALPVDCSGDFGPRGLSVQYTQDVHGCPPAHTGRPWLSVSTHRMSVAVRVCPCVSVSTYKTSVAVHHTHRTSVGVRQHTQDVRGSSWLSVSTHRTSMAVRVCPSAHTGHLWVSVSTHRTSMVVHQYTYQHAGPWTQHAGPSRGLFGTSVGVRQHTQDVRGCPCVSVFVRQHTQDVHGCPSVHISALHTGRLWVSASTQRTSVALRVCPCVSVCVHQQTQDDRGFPSVHRLARCTHRTSMGVRQHTHDVRDCPCVSVSTHRTSLTVRVCPSAHTGRLWLSISTHISTLVLGLSTLALPVDCSGGFGPRGLSVQYTQDVRGCPPAQTGRPWLFVSTHRTSVAVRVCPCVSISTHRKSVAVHQYTYQHAVHTGRPWVSVSTHRMFVCVRQHTHDVCVCPSAHTGRPWLSVCVHQHTQDVRGCPCVSVSTHRTFVVVHRYTYQHVGPWTQHTDPSRGLFG
ncbi:hypothetical protein YC2023_108605 [Brassica napus]